MVGLAGAYSNGLLFASDADEAWAVSEHLVDVVPFAVYRWRRLSVGVDLPLRAEWNDQIGIADPRFNLWAGPLRFGVLAPWGTNEWPFTWDDYRLEAGYFMDNSRFMLDLSTSYGEAGAFARAGIGRRWGAWGLELVSARAWSELPVTTAEIRVTWRHGAVDAWAGSGIMPGVGSPRARVGGSFVYQAVPAAQEEDTAVLARVVDDAPQVGTDTAGGTGTESAVDSGHLEVTLEPSPSMPAPSAPVAAAPVEAAPAAPASAEVAPVAVPVAVPAPVETTATTAEPATPSADDLAKLADAAGGNAGLAAILALLAVAGSAGALKLYKGWSDNKKEIELAKINADAEARKGPDYSTTQPPPCSVKQMETEARMTALHGQVSELSGKLEKLAKKTDALPAGFDADDLEERIVKLEKAAKAKKG
jgi:hypothetical protein